MKLIGSLEFVDIVDGVDVVVDSFEFEFVTIVDVDVVDTDTILNDPLVIGTPIT